MNKDKHESAVVYPHHGVVYEKKKYFKTSVFDKVYQRAYELARNCVELQQESEKERYREDGLDNIITFVGRRGTGKTSAMMSFMEALCQNHVNKDEEDIYAIKDQTGNGWVQFIKIDAIDASLLESGEDIFEAILAKMYRQFLDESEDRGDEALTYRKRELHNRFADIYKKHLNIQKNGKRDRYTAETAISSLRDLSRSTEIKEEFEELVCEYIENKLRNKYDFADERVRNTFLVVAIDDIDMNVESGFEILEKIQRYLKVKHLLVLLAINHEQMKMCCEKHFVKIYEGYSKGWDESEKIQDRVSDLADQYMEKSLPYYSRIYLPSLKKTDYDKKHYVKVAIETTDESRKFVDIKDGVFAVAAQKTMVRYDTEGQKKHFMEPDSLRELNNYLLFSKNLYTLNIPEKEKERGIDEVEEDFLKKLDSNYRRSMDDLLFRYSDVKLSEDASKFFLELSEVDITRRGEKIILDFLRGARVRCSDIEVDKELFECYRENYNRFRYSYGELMRCIYCMGRIEYYDKSLVHAILASYSLTLTKLYYFYRFGDDKMKIDSYNKLKTILAESVAGSWAWNIVPPVSSVQLSGFNGKNSFSHYSGAVKNVDLCKKELLLAEDNFNALINLSKTQNLNDEEVVQVLSGNLKNVFIVMLFLSVKNRYEFTMVESNAGITSKMESVIEGGNVQNPPQACLEFIAGKADYNVLNFINNIFSFEEVLESFVEAVLKMLYRKLNGDKSTDQGTGSNTVTEQKVKSIVERLCGCDGFFKEMNEWHKKYGGMVVPVYATDLYYNLIKRLAKEQMTENSYIVEVNQLTDELKKLFDKIEKKLEKNDEFYEDYRSKEQFKKIFSECPFIKTIRNANANEFSLAYEHFVAELCECDQNSFKGEFEKDFLYM